LASSALQVGCGSSTSSVLLNRPTSLSACCCGCGCMAADSLLRSASPNTTTLSSPSSDGVASRFVPGIRTSLSLACPPGTTVLPSPSPSSSSSSTGSSSPSVGSGIRARAAVASASRASAAAMAAVSCCSRRATTRTSFSSAARSGTRAAAASTADIRAAIAASASLWAASATSTSCSAARTNVANVASRASLSGSVPPRHATSADLRVVTAAEKAGEEGANCSAVAAVVVMVVDTAKLAGPGSGATGTSREKGRGSQRSQRYSGTVSGSPTPMHSACCQTEQPVHCSINPSSAKRSQTHRIRSSAAAAAAAAASAALAQTALFLALRLWGSW